MAKSVTDGNAELLPAGASLTPASSPGLPLPAAELVGAVLAGVPALAAALGPRPAAPVDAADIGRVAAMGALGMPAAALLLGAAVSAC
jgi:hypothetical protein